MVVLGTCDYGCGRDAYYFFKTVNKICCSISHNQCAGLKRIQVEKRKDKLSWSSERRKKMNSYYKTNGGPMLGKTHTEETKKKISIKNKNFKHKRETKRKISRKLRGRSFSEQHKKKLSKAAKKRVEDPDSYFNSIEFRKILKKKMIDGQASYMNSFITNPSKPQVELYKMILKICPYAILNYPCLNYSIDIAIPFLEMAIEYDEPYWHQNIEADKKRQLKLEKEGWKFIRFTKVPEKIKLRRIFNQWLF